MRNARIIVIINLEARRGGEVEEALKEFGRLQGVALDIRAVASGEFTKALEDAIAAQPSRLIVAGGDGSISAAVSRLVGSGIALGVLPAGTTNNFARSIGIPMNIPDAIAAVMDGEPQQITVGRIADRYFCNSVTIGVSAEAVTHINAGRKQLLGRFEYALRGTDHFLNHDHFNCELVLDGAVRRFKTHHVIVANSSHHGGFSIAPENLVHERSLLVTALAVNQNRWHYIGDLLMLPLGLSKRSKYTFTAAAKKIRISTNPPQQVEADGEGVGKTPVEISIAAQTVRVVVPK